MEPLQLLAYESARAARRRAHEALPGAPVVPPTSADPRMAGLRAGLAAALRRTADRVEPCPAACC